jgi:hypothetical protein
MLPPKYAVRVHGGPTIAVAAMAVILVAYWRKVV